MGEPALVATLGSTRETFGKEGYHCLLEDRGGVE